MLQTFTHIPDVSDCNDSECIWQLHMTRSNTTAFGKQLSILLF